MINEQQVVNVDKLHPHPKNAEIYGNEDVSDLIAQIEALGKIVNPIKIKRDYTIISGHRRWQAAKKLGIQEIPFEYIDFDSEEDELSSLVIFNYQRQKTNEQKAREGMVLEETLSDESVFRKLSTLKQNQEDPDMDQASISEDTAPSSVSDTQNEKGTTRDKVAKAIKIGSGRSYDRMKAVINESDRLRKNGDTVDADLLICVLNKAPSTAYKLLQVDLSSLTDEEKRSIQLGKVSANQIIQSHLTGKKPTKAESFKKVMQGLRTAEQNIVDVFNAIDNFEEDEVKQLKSAIESIEKIIPNIKDKISSSQTKIIYY